VITNAIFYLICKILKDFRSFDHPQRMCSLGINGEGKLRAEVHLEKWTERVHICT